MYQKMIINQIATVTEHGMFSNPNEFRCHCPQCGDTFRTYSDNLKVCAPFCCGECEELWNDASQRAVDLGYFNETSAPSSRVDPDLAAAALIATPQFRNSSYVRKYALPNSAYLKGESNCEIDGINEAAPQKC